MFKSILVALDTREYVPSVTQQAIWLACREGRRVLGIQVLDEEELVLPPGVEGISPVEYRVESEAELRAAGQRVLEKFAAQCADAGVVAETMLVVGSTPRVICQQAKSADLIVMGRKGDYIRRTKLFKCCPLEEVVRQAGCPVLVAAAEPRQIARILIAYDGGPCARAALSVAARLADQWQSPLILLTVIEKGVGQEAMAEGQAYLRQCGQPEKAFLREGSPFAEILAVTVEQNIDLIVMGAYCHGQVRELVSGGTVEQVLKKVDRPVLVCR